MTYRKAHHGETAHVELLARAKPEPGPGTSLPEVSRSLQGSTGLGGLAVGGEGGARGQAQRRGCREKDEGRREEGIE